MKTFIIQNKGHLSILLIFFFAFGIRMYRLFQKEDVFTDEGASFFYSNYIDVDFRKNFNNHSLYNGDFICSKLLYNDNSLKDVKNDILNLRRDSRDKSHTNLYYSILRLWFTGIETYNLKKVVFHAVLLNLLFFCLSFYFLSKLLKKLYVNQLLILLTLIIAYLNSGSITNTLYIREYQMQEFFIVLYTYILVVFYDRIKNDFPLKWNDTLYILLATTGLLLSGYFTIIYFILINFIFLIISYNKIPRQYYLYLFLTYCLSLVCVAIVYPKFYDFYNFTVHRKDSLFAVKESNEFIINLSNSLKKYWIDLRGYFISLPALFLFLLVIVFSIVKRASTFKQLPFLLGICALISSLIIYLFAPFKGILYIMPLLPIISLIITSFITKFSHKQILIASILFSLIYLEKSFTRNDVFFAAVPISETYKTNPKTLAIISPNVELYSILPYFDKNRLFLFPAANKEIDNSIKTILNFEDKVFFIHSNNSNSDNTFFASGNILLKERFKVSWYYYGDLLSK